MERVEGCSRREGKFAGGVGEPGSVRDGGRKGKKVKDREGEES